MCLLLEFCGSTCIRNVASHRLWFFFQFYCNIFTLAPMLRTSGWSISCYKNSSLHVQGRDIQRGAPLYLVTYTKSMSLVIHNWLSVWIISNHPSNREIECYPHTMGEHWPLKKFSLNHPVKHIQKPKLPKLYVRVETSTSYFIIHNQFVK